MGLSSCFPVYARNRDGSHCRNDQGKAPSNLGRRTGRFAAGLITATSILLWAFAVAAQDQIRIAKYNVELGRKGAGLLLRDILRDEDEDIRQTAKIIAFIKPDLLVLTGFDYDRQSRALIAYRDLIADQGHEFPFHFSSLPNSGVQSGVDLNGDGEIGGPQDAYGFGYFAGSRGMAILSRFEIDVAGFQDFTGLLWADLPSNLAPPDNDAHRRLSSTAHWVVKVRPTPEQAFSILTWHATPPVFDGPEDINGRRNQDEAQLWLELLNRNLPDFSIEDPFVMIGDANLDPLDGEGRPEALNALLAHPRLQDPRPMSRGAEEASVLQGGVNSRHQGNPALDTVDWSDQGATSPGNLRVDYILPSRDWRIKDQGVFWPATDDPDHALLGSDGNGASRHRLVWVDLMFESLP